MRHRAAIIDALLGHGDAEVVGKGIDHATAHAAAGGAAGDDHAVAAKIDQVAGERGAEERAGVLLGQQDIAFDRGDFRDEAIAFRWYRHQFRHFGGKPALIEALLGRDMRVKHRQALFAELRKQRRNMAHRFPAGIATAGLELLDRLPERRFARADGAILDINDQQCRALAQTAGPAEAGSAIAAFFLFADDAGPGAGGIGRGHPS